MYDCCVAGGWGWLRLSESREQEVKGIGKEENKDVRAGIERIGAHSRLVLRLAVGEAVVGFQLATWHMRRKTSGPTR